MKRQVLLFFLVCIPTTLTRANGADNVVADLSTGDGTTAIAQIKSQLRADPARAVDRLNSSWMEAMLKAHRYDDVVAFANAGSIAVARDTWPVEQLQRYRVRALLEDHKPEQALAAAKGLFNVSGMGSMIFCLQQMVDCLRAARPDDPAVANRFKYQQLALAAEDEKVRKEQSADLGPLVMDSVEIDHTPFDAAIEKLKDAKDYNRLYARGNLLLLAGRVKEARKVFERVYQMAPQQELPYATEGLAKAIKAEAGALGKANAFLIAVRPNE